MPIMPNDCSALKDTYDIILIFYLSKYYIEVLKKNGS